MSNATLLAFLREQKFQNLRVLDNGTIIGTIDLMFTRSLCVGLGWDSWEARYCYPDRELATMASYALIDDDHPPLPGYIATRGRPKT
jgi:hypothetical protein